MQILTSPSTPALGLCRIKDEATVKSDHRMYSTGSIEKTLKESVYSGTP